MKGFDVNRILIKKIKKIKYDRKKIYKKTNKKIKEKKRNTQNRKIMKKNGLRKV